MNRPIILSVIVLIIFLLAIGFLVNRANKNGVDLTKMTNIPDQAVDNPLSIDVMRKKSYSGSDLKIEQTLDPGNNYNQYIASYMSDGLKIYGLLTVPQADKPATGFPVIIFNHGYIPPNQYKTTERYVAYVDAFARDGYIVFKPDYRGNGESEGSPEGAYYSPAYATDVLNAVASLKKYPDADPNRFGMWGHSMGGNITLRDIVVQPTAVKAAVIWGGVVGTYDDILNNWHRTGPRETPPPQEQVIRERTRASLVTVYGQPKSNPTFWDTIDPNSHLQDITIPVQLDAGLADEEVPWQFSQGLNDRLTALGKNVQFYTYDGADHNISEPSFDKAMQRSIDFFDKYVKGGES